METYIGRLLDGRYEILEAIGNGGMAVVFKALDHRLNRLVAVKILKDELSRDEEFRRRFRVESQAVAMMSHPNIVAVHDVSHEDGMDYLVMELIEGVTLKQYLERKGALNWRETLHFSMQIAKALEHAHSRGIIHRDIKPHNIMILKDGSIKVADFGIARVASDQSTLTREALGSVHYISPEQAKGNRVDNRSDLYSLGVVMYEMLTGRPPYDGETPVSVAIQHINGGALLPSLLVDGIPRGLEQITLHAMSAELPTRYSSATEMLRDMEEFRKNPATIFHFTAVPKEEPQPAKPHTGMTRTEAERYAAARRGERPAPPPPKTETKPERHVPEKKKQKPNYLPWILGGAGALLVLVILLVILLGGSDNKPEETETTTVSAPSTVIVPKFIGTALEDIDPEDYPELIVDVDNAEFVHNDEYKNGIVCGQSPDPDAEVKAGRVRTVKLVVSMGKESTEMPVFSNITGNAAMSQLTAMNLGLQISMAEEHDDSIRAGYVTRTEPEAGSELNKGQKVVIYVSLGAQKMPDVSGQSKDNAANMIDALEMNLKVVYLQERSDNVKEGCVIRTEPAADSDITKNQKITVYISTGDGKVVVPQVKGFNRMDAVSLLKDAGLKYDIVEEYSETVEKDKVIAQSAEPNSRVEKDTVITLTVSKGPQPTEPPTEPVTEPTEPPTEEPTVTETDAEETQADE